MKRKLMKATMIPCFVAILLFSVSFIVHADGEPTTSIGGHTLSLSTNLEIVYFANFQNVPEGAECGVVYSDTPDVDYSCSKLVPLNESVINGGLTYYKYSLRLVAKKMSEDFYAKSYIKDGDTIYYGNLDKYSVLQYAYSKRNETDPGDKDISLKDLVDKVLNYGAASQQFLVYKTDRLANAAFHQITAVNATLADGTVKGMYMPGDELTITAKDPAEMGSSTCYTFDHWENKAGENIGSDNTLQVAVPDADESYTAVFNVGHNVVIDPAVAATCTEDGLTEGSHCSVCNLVIVPQEVIPASHTLPDEWDYDATNHWKTCSVCSGHFDTAEHTYTEVDGKNICSVCGYEEGSTLDLIFTLNSSGQSYTLTGRNKLETNTDVVIPSQYRGLPVTEIGAEAFKSDVYPSNTAITSVSIPASVTTIGKDAFRGCTYLTQVTFAEGMTLTNVGTGVFCNTSIESLDLPSGLTSIPYEFCHACSKLENVHIKGGVSSIAQYAFSSCSSLKTITIPASVTSFADGAFWSDDKITTVYFGGYEEGWEAISKGTQNNSTILTADRVYGDQRLSYVKLDNQEAYKVSAGTSTETDIYIPETYNGLPVTQVVSIPSHATSVHMKDSVTSISAGAFEGQNKLTTVELSNNITNLGANTFKYCTKLTSITLPQSLTEISTNAFVNCPLLKTVYIKGPSPALTYVYDNAFSGTTDLDIVYYGGTEDQWLNIYYYENFDVTNVVYNWSN